MREPDPDTIRRAQAGDLAAFEALVRETQADSWRLAYHLTRDRAAADDVTQEAFLRVYRALATYRGEHQFSSWLLRIVRNCAMDSYQRSKRERLARERITEETTTSGPARPGSSEDRLRIEEAVARLPHQLREPFVLIDVLGFSYRETSEILGVKIGTLKSRMHRAHGALVRLLVEDAADEM